jgi:hypothetical protein
VIDVRRDGRKVGVPAVVCHFSEDPTITEFTPHVAKTADDPRPLVWAVDESRTPGYWFPRDCPRAMAWVVAGTTDEDRRYVLGPGGDRRVHAVEYRWLERIASCQLYRYDLPADSFRLVAGEAPHAYVSESAVRPVEPPVRLPGLLELHERARIQLRVFDNLWAWWDAVITTTLAYSAIRMANARARRTPA